MQSLSEWGLGHTHPKSPRRRFAGGSQAGSVAAPSSSPPSPLASLPVASPWSGPVPSAAEGAAGTAASSVSGGRTRKASSVPGRGCVRRHRSGLRAGLALDSAATSGSGASSASLRSGSCPVGLALAARLGALSALVGGSVHATDSCRWLSSADSGAAAVPSAATVGAGSEKAPIPRPGRLAGAA